jgi:AcrR family transcriptional regulator
MQPPGLTDHSPKPQSRGEPNREITMPRRQLKRRESVIAPRQLSRIARSPRPALRFSPDERRKMIVSEAIEFFAEFGFAENTRSLAKRLGVTQPLIFRYFPTKEALIEAVFDEVFARMAKHDWASFIREEGKDLKSRLVRFCIAYAAENYDYTWIRLYMFAGLAGGELNRRCIAKISGPLLKLIALEIRRENGFPAGDQSVVTDEEISLLWVLHAGLYYHAIRRHIYGLPVNEKNWPLVVDLSVSAILMSYPSLLVRLGVERKIERPEAYALLTNVSRLPIRRS